MTPTALASLRPVPGKGRPATARQGAELDRLWAELNPREYEHDAVYEQAAVALGITHDLTWPADGTSGPRTLAYGDADALAEMVARDGMTSRVASALITAARRLTSVPVAPCYCERRGEPCRTVHYYDGFYDYECGLS